MTKPPKESRFEFVAVAALRARQLLAGASPRASGPNAAATAHREVLARKVQKTEGDPGAQPAADLRARP